MNDIVVCTTFPNYAFDVYARQMLTSFMEFWPQEVQLCVALDDNLLAQQVEQIIKVPQNGVSFGWDIDHAAFVKRNAGRDDPKDYRKQAVRFCHKVFVIKRVLDAIESTKASGEPTPRYLIWLDADVHTIRSVSMKEIRACLPREGDAVAYLGRKDWPHSECGWLAFDLEQGGADVIKHIVDCYTTDIVFNAVQWDDSWIFDMVTGTPVDENIPAVKKTNLSPHAIGLDAWESSPLCAWSVHHKGPDAKQRLAVQRPQPQQQSIGQKVIIQTKNSIPDEEIRAHIAENQKLIQEWLRPCLTTEEEIVVVSAGPMLIAEDLRAENAAHRKIVCVKHAIDEVKRAGIQPWATILLDPRPHVSNFVENPDNRMIWFVASQVAPDVTRKLLCSGCRVIGYHATVGAGEIDLLKQQEHAIVNGGSATATRGLYLLGLLGFKNFRLYGYDLCYPDKVDMNARDEKGQPKYMEFSLGLANSPFPLKRCFWTEPQFIAQFEELNDILNRGVFNIKAFGWGILPFIMRAKELADLRTKENRNKMLGEHPGTYRDFLNGNHFSNLESSCAADPAIATAD